jgi:hypothetical protein
MANRELLAKQLVTFIAAVRTKENEPVLRGSGKHRSGPKEPAVNSLREMS